MDEPKTDIWGRPETTPNGQPIYTGNDGDYTRDGLTGQPVPTNPPTDRE